MMEGVANEIPEDKFCEAVLFAHQEVRVNTLRLYVPGQCVLPGVCVWCGVCLGPATTGYTEGVEERQGKDCKNSHSPDTLS